MSETSFSSREIPERPDLHRMMQDLRAGGDVDDDDFDAIYPKAVQKLSRIHWTPLAVARRATQLLAPDASSRVLDVGSGAGKLCLVGALTTRGHFTGIEQSPALVGLAKDLVRRYKLERVRFMAGDAAEASWDGFSAIYLYNPYAQRIAVTQRGPSADGAASDAYVRAIDATHTRLVEARPGTRVAVFNGYGGERPGGYDVLLQESYGASTLELWVKR